MRRPHVLAWLVLLAALTAPSVTQAAGLRQALGGRSFRLSGGFGRSAPAAVLFALAATVSGASECNGALPVAEAGGILTFARSSGAACVRSDGTLVALTANQPRVTAAGALVEPAATNLAQRSEAIGTAPWSYASAVVAATTVTADYAAAPSGVTSAERLQQPAVPATAGQYSDVRQTWSAAAAGPYTVSFWARGTSAAGQGVAWVYQGGVRGSLYFAYTTTWSRFAYVATITAASSPLVIYGGNGDFGLSLASAADYLLWGVQVEAGAAPATSYVATTNAPATRTAETLLATTPAGLSRTEGCAAMTVVAPWTGAAPRDAELLDTSAANTRFLYAASGSTSVSASDGTHTPAVAAGFSAGLGRRYRVTWSSGGNALQLSNVTTSTTGTATAFTTWPAFGSTLSMGGASGTLVGGVTLSSVVLGAAAGACP